uniref:Putative proteoglycan 4 n=1 Tax=Nyssomyia neivai TaxID=330878 RepID=A0A1L8E3F9_9DIPT
MMNGGVKNGLSTLNRLLGKKNKDDSSTPTKQTTFSRSMSNLDTSSQHNKIVPLAAMSNAPFEQTFRITVSLPRDQLYVARVGAKTHLAQLMELTCVNKQLDRDKYEFRHPMDNSQVFSNDLTIGEVGLNEIRLVPKTERHHNGFNIEDLGKMRLPGGNRESLSSSEVSRNSRQFLKTTSPYSSTNSLNSVESSGSHRHQPPVAPIRKKRAAPRPPSQNSIPEHQMDINRNNTITGEFKKPLPVKKNFHVSSPNLTIEENHQLVTSAEVHGSPIAERYSSVTDLRSHEQPPAIVEANNTRIRPMSVHIVNGNHHVNGKESPVDANHSRTSSESSEMRDGALPEPTPRKRQLFAAKKKKAAPAPPPRSVPPVPTPRSIPKSESSADEETTHTNLPNGNVSKVMLNVVDAAEAINANLVKQNVVTEERKECVGVKVVELKPNGLSIAINTVRMKQLETPAKVSITEIRRESTNSSDEDDHRVNIYSIKMGKVIEPEEQVPKIEVSEQKQLLVEEKIEQPKEEIRESVKDEKIPVEKSKSEKIPEVARTPSPLWTYTLPAPPKFADGNSTIPDDAATLNGNVFYDYMSLADDTRTIQSDSNTTLISDVDIRPVIREVIDDPYTDADVINSDLEDGYQRNLLLQSLEKRRERYIENEFAFLTKMDDDKDVVEPLKKQHSIEEGKNEVIGELNSVISSNRSVIKKAEVQEEIDAPKPCNLSNFRISTYSVEDVPKPVNGHASPEEEFNEEDFLRSATIDVDVTKQFVKRTNNAFRKTTPVTRSTSFHSTRIENNSFVGTPRSSSYISLLAAQKFESRKSLEFQSPPRRYSSELSITDSPSLQSIEVMKSILSSSRKNSTTQLAEQQDGKPEIKSEPKPEAKIVTIEEPPMQMQVEIVERQELETAVLVQRDVVEAPKDIQVAASAEEVPKKWVYKGPPKINLSAWNERPKVQVCIKSDSDYCFGGSTTLPRGFRTEQAVNMLEKKEQDVVNKHLPVVRGVEYKKNIPVPEDPPSETITLRKPEVRQKPVNRVNSITSASLNARPLSLGNFSKIAPVVRGFRAEEEAQQQQQLRPISVTKVNNVPTIPPAAAEVKKQQVEKMPDRRTIAVVSNGDAAPFSQHTLRKTGLKEKILAAEDASQKVPTQRSFHTRQQTINHSISLPPQPIPAATPAAEPPTKVTPIPPPPPPQVRPVVRAVVKKQISAPDPRDQLLDSIRNFNRTSLKKM